MDINQHLDEIAADAARDSPTEEATSNFIGDVTTTEEEMHFVTGSTYKGSWDALGMTGVGRYVMPNGTIYEGEMWDGMFHGHGSLYWSNNQRLDVVHNRGKLQEHRYNFADGLSYQNEDWSYCRFPDRRFYESTKKGLRPGGRTLRSAKQPTKILPAGCYDAGDGVFDPKTLCVTSYDDSNKILRTPTREECDWIAEYCRKSWTEPTGYRTSLNENWSDDPPELPYSLAMSEDSPDAWWKRLTNFERDLAANVDEENDASSDNGYLEMPDLCLCEQYVILGEPCHCLPVPATSEIEWQDDLGDGRFYGEQSSQCHEDEETEGKDGLFHPYRGPFVDASAEYVFSEGINEGIEAFAFDVPGIKVPEEIPQNVSSEKFDEPHRASKKIVEDEVDDEQPLSPTAESRPEMENEETRNEENVQTDTGEQLEEISKPIDTVEEELPTESSEVDHNRNTRKSEDSAENDMPQESESWENSVEDQDLPKSNGEIEKNVNSQEKIIAMNADEPETVKQVHEEEGSSEMAIKKSSLPDFSDKNHKHHGDREDMEENVVEYSTKEQSDAPAISSRTSLENHDYVTAVTIPGEKVSGAAEPETTNDRRTETKLLPKAKQETGSIEEVQQDLQTPPMDTEAIISDDVITTGTSVKLEDDVKSSAAGTAIFGEEFAEEELKYDDRINAEASMQLQGDNKSQCDASETEISPEELTDTSRSKFGDEISQKTELISDSEIPSRRLLTEIEDIASSGDEKTAKKSSSSLKSEQISLKKVHPSLASLPSKEQRLEHEEIIEIYKKIPKKDKPKKKCSNANVWRLSSTLREYSTQTKMPCYSCGLRPITNTEDLRAGPALTTPRSRPAQYGRKPCAAQIHKPTTQEVPVIALPCREEYPFKIQAKPDRFTHKQSRSNMRNEK